jgi:hypothetical protein
VSFRTISIFSLSASIARSRPCGRLVVVSHGNHLGPIDLHPSDAWLFDLLLVASVQGPWSGYLPIFPPASWVTHWAGPLWIFPDLLKSTHSWFFFRNSIEARSECLEINSPYIQCCSISVDLKFLV